MAPSSNTFSLKKLAKRLQKPAQNLLGIGAIGSLIVGGGFLVYACPLALVALAPFAVAGVYSAATRRHSSLTRSSPFLITSNSIDSASDNHYTLLGIQQNATSKEITAAYRKLALECHPDLRKQGKTVDEELFKSICNAYAVLSDPELRQQYNIGGDEAVRCYLAHMRGRPAAETNIQQGWKWNWNLLQSLWWNSQAELPPLSESFRQQYHFYTQLEEAVAMGLPKLPCELVEMLQNNGYSMIANAVQLAISSSFHCSMCNQSIDGRLEGICYCIKRSTQFPHHRNRCCHKPTNLLKKFKKRASTIGSECQSFIYMATKRSEGIPMADHFDCLFK